MAKIVHSEEAPADANFFSLGNAEVELSGGSFETEDRATIGAAIAHPWLDVEFDVVEGEATKDELNISVRPEDDVLASENSKAFDPEQIEKDRVKVTGNDPTAIQSGLDQSDPVEVATTNFTLAADDADDADDTDDERFSD